MDRQIFQDWLDTVADHVFADRFDAWADSFARPLTVVGPAGQSRLETDDQLRQKFDQWRILFDVQRVSHMIRVAHDCHFMTEDMITGSYTTELLSHNAQRVMDPFDSTMILVRQGDGRWRASELKSGMAVQHRHLLHTSTPPVAPQT